MAKCSMTPSGNTELFEVNFDVFNNIVFVCSIAKSETYMNL